MSEVVPTTITWDPRDPGTCFASRRLQADHADGGQQGEEEGLITANLQTIQYPLGASCNEYELQALQRLITEHEAYFDGGNRRDLLPRYRAAVRDALAHWQAHSTAAAAGEDDNFELLTVSYSLMHLTNVFLPLLESHSQTFGDPFGQPGVATAAMVRYLRYNHIPVAETAPVLAMLESSVPETYQGGELYWWYLERLVVRGCLEKAWTVLQRHSMYAEAQQGSNDPYLAKKFKDICTQFEELRALFLLAPLPGSRSDVADDAIEPGPDDDLAADFYTEGLDVSSTDYRLWDMEIGDALSIDNPGVRKHRMWKDFCWAKRRSLVLTRSVPQLNRLLDILTGEHSKIEFETWAEAFCADLLYVQPDLKPQAFATRARRMVALTGGAKNVPTVETILSIMEGNVAQAFSILQAVGGKSAAALPATVTALMFSLFVESEVILDEDYSDLKIQYLCEAASAIITSLVHAKPSGIGLAIRLLLPYAIKEGNREVVTNIALMMEHHWPDGDGEATSLLQLVRPVLEMKSARVLDGCCSQVLGCYSRHVAAGRHADATHWLVKGIECEKVLFGEKSQKRRSCHRQLASHCLRYITILLKALTKEQATEPQDLVDAKAIAEVLEGVDVKEARVLVALCAIFDESNAKTMAKHLISCLKDQMDPLTGYCGPLAPASMHWPLLRIAREIINLQGRAGKPPQAAFDCDGVKILMERTLQLEGVVPEHEMEKMRELLATALASAVVAENASRSETSMAPWIEAGKIRSMKLNNHSLAMQERAVQHMLGDY